MPTKSIPYHARSVFNQLVLNITLAATFFLGSTTPAFATDRYVNLTSGTNSGDCSAIASPCLTMEYAGSKTAPGDNVLVRAATFTPATNATKTLRITNVTGTLTQPITFKPYPGETVIIDGTGRSYSNSESLVELDTVTYVDFVGFEVRNGNGRGIAYKNATNIVISNNKIHGFHYRALGGWADGAILQNNELYNNALSNQGNNSCSPCSGWPGVIQTASRYGSGTPQTPSQNTIIRNNLIYNSWGEGIIANFADTIQITGNIVHDTYSIGIYVDHAKDVTISGNYLYSTSNTYNKSGKRANGITMATEGYGSEEPKIKLQNITIANNVIAGAEKGISYFGASGYGSYNSYQNVKIYHNTIYNPINYPILIDAAPAGGATGGEIKNNIVFKGSPAEYYDLGNGNAWTFAGNYWVPSLPTGSAHVTDFTAATIPFVNPTIGGAAQGFALSAALPNTGAQLGVTTDFNNQARSATPTIGAFEFAGVTPTPTPTPTPSPTPVPCANNPDLNSDTKVNIVDYTLLASHFMQSGANIIGDVNCDGTVNLLDYTILVNNFSPI